MKSICYALIIVLIQLPILRASANVLPTIYVTVSSQAYIVNQVAGEKNVRVKVLVGPNSSPEAYFPTPKEIYQLSTATIFFSIGLPFEKIIIDKLRNNLKKLKVVDMADNIKHRKFKSKLKHHHHHHHGSHSGSEHLFDPHVWLSPLNVKTMALNTYTQLTKLLPNKQKILKHNLETFLKKLDEIYLKQKSLFRPFQGSTILVFHPAYGYFSDLYNLQQESIEIEGKVATAKQLLTITKMVKDKKIKALYVEPMLDKKMVQNIAKILGLSVVIVNPIPYNLLEGLESMGQTFYKGLSKQ
ncbi:MAG: zinc ABC transporter substrate-binding protein [Bacteriovoracaceae bacterium]|nr:zinc ABC transporter substrate-binding protein [Bacteriovoracaceae bacterium]